MPFEYVIGTRKIPVIPFFTNVYVPPLPSARRCAALGKAVAEIVKGRNERVAIVASGGMSHFPGTRKYLHPGSTSTAGSSHSSRRVTPSLTEHDPDAARRGGQYRDAQLGDHVRCHRSAGRGIDRLHPDLASRALHDGFLPERARKTQPTAEIAQQFGGFKFQNEGFQFYKHPPAEAYGLNRLLFESRHSADLRSRILTTSTRWRRSTSCSRNSESGEELINVGKGGLVSEHVGPLVEAGAHPLQALMSLHVIFSTSHTRGQQAMAAGQAKS